MTPYLPGSKAARPSPRPPCCQRPCGRRAGGGGGVRELPAGVGTPPAAAEASGRRTARAQPAAPRSPQQRTLKRSGVSPAAATTELRQFPMTSDADGRAGPSGGRAYGRARVWQLPCLGLRGPLRADRDERSVRHAGAQQPALPECTCAQFWRQAVGGGGRAVLPRSTQPRSLPPWHRHSSPCRDTVTVNAQALGVCRRPWFCLQAACSAHPRLPTQPAGPAGIAAAPPGSPPRNPSL